MAESPELPHTMIPDMKMMKLAVPLCLLQAIASLALVSGQPPPSGYLQAVIPGTFDNGNTFCVSANDGKKKADDLRDATSYYANIRNSCQRRTTFRIVEVYENEYVLEAVDIRTDLGPIATGWYLSVHDDRDSDNAGVNGDLRVILQPELRLSTVWEYVVGFVEGKSILVVTKNFGPAGEGSLGMALTLAEAPYRSSESFYIAVTGDWERSLDIQIVPEAIAA